MSATAETARLPRLLAGIPASGVLSLADHMAVHGPAPEIATRRRGGDTALIDEVERAGLRGRGGAGFPTALKMHAVAGARSRGRTVLVNAAEGEPASAKDATLMASVPHLVLDGAALAARALGAAEIFVCVSDAALETVHACQQALAERAGSLREAATQLVAVPHSYVSGQESALVHYLNGGEAKPTFTPPMIFERGVAGRPTMVSNAETFAHLALIARHGADWFRGLGTPEHPGSALVTLSGPVEHPGVYEIEHGAPLLSLVEAAGGLRERLRAILVGGYAGTWIDGRRAGEMTIDDGHLGSLGASTGAGVLVLLGESSCGVAETVRIARWLARESAGQCGPCVHGLDAIAQRLQAWAFGSVGPDGAAELARLSAVVRGRGACRHPDGALRFIASAMTVFEEEFADHSAHGPCDACSARPALPLPDPRERPGAVAELAR
jgi:NADH:ubiquinone oxidoreductase subunit F (NADH-binding)